MGDRVAKDALFAAFAEVAKALGNGHRAELIDVLRVRRDVSAIPGDGTRIYYRLASERVGDLWEATRDVAAAHHVHLDQLVRDYLGDRSTLDEIGREELAARLAIGDVVVIDVRPAVEYAAGHIAGARSMPIERLAACIDALPRDLAIVAYCRGPYCVFADDAVRLLRRRGHRAHRLEGGYPEWQRASLPVEIT